jgi:UDP-N-acetylglucosamine diphosphorylase/glucosamine-1-phosphate N-acetyltransferase
VIDTVAVFEDSLTEDMGSIAFTRPVFDLRCGLTSLRARISRHYPDAKLHVLCREALAAVAQEELAREGVEATVNDLAALGQTGALLINGAVLAHGDMPSLDGENIVAKQDGRLVYARLDGAAVPDFAAQIQASDAGVELSAPAGVSTNETQDLSLVRYPWDLIIANAEAIEKDVEVMGAAKPSDGVVERGAFVRVAEGEGVTVYDGDEATRLAAEGKIPLHVGSGSVVHPGTVLDVTGGPIYIDEGVTVRPPSLIDGPCALGAGALIDGAKIREGCSIGPVCKVGGEVEESIFHGYSNKHHDGFLGHAYVGEWVNIGALATNSDLKNNYGNVDVFLTSEQYVSGQATPSGEYKMVGAYIGDHTKVGIGVMLNTGTHVGVACNVVFGPLPPKYVPSFSWPARDGFVAYDIDRMLDTAERVMGRRDRDPSEAYKTLIRHIFEETAADRDRCWS